MVVHGNEFNKSMYPLPREECLFHITVGRDIEQQRAFAAFEALRNEDLLRVGSLEGLWSDRGARHM